MGIKQRKSYANYLKVANAFEFMGAGFSDLNEAPTAVSASKRYVSDSSTTKTITGYEWSTAYVTDMIRSEKAVDFICNIGEMQLTGAAAETEYVIVDLDVPATAANEFKARKINVAVEVATFDNADGVMGATGNLLGKGNMILGTFNTETKTFKEGFIAAV